MTAMQRLTLLVSLCSLAMAGYNYHRSTLALRAARIAVAVCSESPKKM